MTTIHTAVEEKDYDAIKSYLQQGGSIDAVNKNGDTPLIIATEMGSRSMVRYLLNKEPDLSIRNKSGERALTIAKRQKDKPIIKLLVIRHAIAKKYIEAEDSEDKQTLINKLITTLLYKSNRHPWDETHCQRIRYYLHCLTNKFSDFNKNDYLKYIRKQETKNNDFYGSYLSEDSDSEEERAFRNLDKKSISKQEEKAKKYQVRGQIEKIFYKNNTSLHSRGDLKDIKNASAIFDLNERAQIHYGIDINEEKIERDLKRLNHLIQEGQPLEEAQKQVKTRFFIAQFRGITHLTSKWNQPSRAMHRKENEISKPQYSAAVYKAADIDLYKDYQLANKQIKNDHQSIYEHAAMLREILLTLREPRPCSYEKYSYANIAYLLQNIYTQDYDGFHELIQSHSLFVLVSTKSDN